MLSPDPMLSWDAMPRSHAISRSHVIFRFQISRSYDISRSNPSYRFYPICIQHAIKQWLAISYHNISNKAKIIQRWKPDLVMYGEISCPTHYVSNKKSEFQKGTLLTLIRGLDHAFHPIPITSRNSQQILRKETQRIHVIWLKKLRNVIQIAQQVTNQFSKFLFYMKLYGLCFLYLVFVLCACRKWSFHCA